MPLIPHNQINPDKVVNYIRWSSLKQEKGTTFELQLKEFERYCKRLGWNFHNDDDHVFVDKAKRGSSMNGRPELQRLRDAVLAGKVDCVVVFKVDRLSRNIEDCVYVVLKEWKYRTHFHSIKDEVSTSLSEQAFREGMAELAKMAERETRTLRVRGGGGRQRIAEDGLWPGGRVPYGYARDPKDKHRLLRFEPEAEVVRRIFQLYLQGHGPQYIASTLNQDGITHRGRPWRHPAIRAIVAMPEYVGDLSYGDYTMNYERKVSGDPEAGLWRSENPEALYVRDAEFCKQYDELGNVVSQAVIDRDTWEGAQRIVASRSTTPSRNLASNWLLSSKILRCSSCGSGLVTDSRGYYRCRKSMESGKVLCDAGRIPKDLLETAVAELIQAKLKGWAASGHLEELEASRNHQIQQLEHTIRAAEARIASAEQADANFVRAIAEATPQMVSLLTKQFTKAIEEAHEAKAQADALIARCRQEIKRLMASSYDHKAIAQIAAQINVWESLSIAQRKELIRQLISGIHLHKPKRLSLNKWRPRPVIVWRMADPAKSEEAAD